MSSDERESGLRVHLISCSSSGPGRAARLTITMIALQIRLLRMRVGMRDRHDLVGGERLRAFAGFLQNRDQFVFPFILERILQPLLNFTSALGRMFDIPMCGLRDGLN